MRNYDEEEPEDNEIDDAVIHLADNNIGLIHKDTEAEIVTVSIYSKGIELYLTYEEWQALKQLMFQAMTNDTKGQK